MFRRWWAPVWLVHIKNTPLPLTNFGGSTPNGLLYTAYNERITPWSIALTPLKTQTWGTAQSTDFSRWVLYWLSTITPILYNTFQQVLTVFNEPMRKPLSVTCQKNNTPLPPLGVEWIGIWQNFVSKKNTPLTPSGGRGVRHMAELCFKKEHPLTPSGGRGDRHMAELCFKKEHSPYPLWG